jgi:hypothetical protein
MSTQERSRQQEERMQGLNIHIEIFLVDVEPLRSAVDDTIFDLLARVSSAI